MQEKDVLSVQYFEDPNRFADLINGFVCDGKNVVDASQVKECNRIIPRKQKSKGSWKTRTLIRDVVREVQAGTRVLVMSLENQSDIHYAMLVRTMDGDSAEYSEQLRKKKKEHREKGDLTGAEYLSGIEKEEKLIPVVTLVVYFGTEPWDGPKTLKEMLDLSGVPKELEGMVNDYPIHLLEVRRYQHLEKFQTDLKYVFGFLQNEQDGKKLKEYIEENRMALEHIQEDAYGLISVTSHSKELERMKEMNRNEEGDYDMCKGLREWMEDERRQGEENGKEIGIKIGEENGKEIGKQIGIKIGEENGKKIGIRLAKQVIRMQLSGTSRAEIAEKCQITMKEVDMILDDDVA